MKPSVAEILAALESIAPTAWAEEWDNVGLMVGAPGAEVSGVLVALDATLEAVESTAAAGAECLVVHHPLLFKPLSALDTERPVGQAIEAAMKKGVAVLAVHTNLDAAPGGVSDVLAVLLGLDAIEVLAPKAGQARVGLGRIGRLAVPLRLKALVEQVKEVLSVDAVRVVGRPEVQVRSLAVCGGSAGDLVEAAFARGAHALLAGEISHHAAREAEALGLALIEAGHYATEAPMVPVLAERLGEELNAAGFSIKVVAHAAQKEPFEWV